jgi:hypothetical protein
VNALFVLWNTDQTRLVPLDMGPRQIKYTSYRRRLQPNIPPSSFQWRRTVSAQSADHVLFIALPM